MATLNLGCGDDYWGDVRVDVDEFTQLGIPSGLNLKADAHFLPFREKVFSETRCFHVLEHLKNPAVAIEEIRRVSERAVLRFPIDDGYKRRLLIAWSELDLF